MNQDIWVARYTQLNERSRWYASQLWYVPFAYVALVGLGFEKILSLQGRLRAFAFGVLALLSFASFVHILSVKYFERCAVREMQKLEKQYGQVASRGGSLWFLSFSSYIRLIPLAATYAFVWKATGPDVFTAEMQQPIRWLALTAAALTSILVWWFDRKRNEEVTREIREGVTETPTKETAAA